ncbi:MAG: hypothetical protein AAGF97_04930 [Planctomycetota bacterium]
MAQLKRRQKLLNVALGTLFALGIEVVLLGAGRLIHHLSCLAIGIGTGLTVGWFTDARIGCISGLLAWGAARIGTRLLPQLSAWFSSTQTADEGELRESWSRLSTDHQSHGLPH